MATPEGKRRHEFQDAARTFRAGKLSLAEFVDRFFPDTPPAEATVQTGDTDLGFARLKPRAADCHKGDFGHVLLVGGSATMPGAIALSGLAALRSGAGLVTVATSRPAQPIVASLSPCLMTTALSSDVEGRIDTSGLPEIQHHARRATCVAIGPGLGRSDGITAWVAQLYEQLELPMVVDADGINAIAGHDCVSRAAGPRVLTPHPGEFQRLLGQRKEQRAAQESAAVDWAASHGGGKVVLLLKGHQTFVTDGQRKHHNTSGSPAMATAGAGDVLTGVIAALIAQGLSGWDAACLGALVHGLAGELAAESRGPVGVIATDLIDKLPKAIRQFGIQGAKP